MPMRGLVHSASDAFTFSGISQGFVLSDFWRWNAFHLLGNITRARLAEFIVAQSLGLESQGPLEEWSSHDLVFEGKRIEVKASAYIQDWPQERLSNPRFSIRKARRMTADGRYEARRQRNSELYIFSLFTETDIGCADPLQLEKWSFYPVPTSAINTNFSHQKSIGLEKVSALCPHHSDYFSLRGDVSRMLTDTAYDKKASGMQGLLEMDLATSQG